MTLEEIKSSDKLFLTPQDISEVLKCDPQLLRWTAKNAPLRLGFPVTVVGNRTRIPRLQFLAYLEGKMPSDSTAL